MKCAYSTNIGAKRKSNQDAYLAANVEKDGILYYVFAVADGLGGHRSGEVASQIAIDNIKEHIGEIQDFTDYQEVNAFFNDINKEIIHEGVMQPEELGMATTLTMAIVHADKMVIYHVGDSRAYRINAGGIEHLTKDHSLVQALIDRGRITPTEAKDHPQKNIITRALGTDEVLKADLFEYRLYPGDQVLLCSDGLYNMVSDEEIHRIVMENDIEEATRKLVNLANYNGGTDNITLIIFKPEFQMKED
ncbi:Stp1/IreP family PP2C-type Ser/Thr phosphatase [uncultured Pseudoramibacter sp.]|jgi:serine/threonine protein phosphatase PrpC|uniref:Stp1/IreP family PP2C-type Ser/Thr phosphatase n=1 Tax=Candidatus Pseudoramibacter fermentans TaxID=2594427 RepID=A0A6L5GPU9_9FIRM|nr:Stp1/IreP family PP2C-type Ser/Thr phosphatase [uncultured Pseudoramibacter sp.]MQM71870.1 Stp1/IreP family PP2C-type Ser/Thr phosphatase [Candidatus Pseudoramibacter fermentans]RRF91734.1 MAG: Stp1/IreP family PP2C-type Ser/Thr phosphatase [Eubacteriaceae bacterium]